MARLSWQSSIPIYDVLSLSGTSCGVDVHLPRVSGISLLGCVELPQAGGPANRTIPRLGDDSPLVCWLLAEWPPGQSPDEHTPLRELVRLA